jgi:hypothetical protein
MPLRVNRASCIRPCVGALIWTSLGILVAGMAIIYWGLRQRSVDLWLASYIRGASKRKAVSGEPVHLLLCVCDHWEPQNGKPPPEQAAARVKAWVENYPKLFSRFADSDGRSPRHSFFFPIDEYVPEHVDGIAELCRAGFGEVEIHHHHDNDTGEALRARLLEFIGIFRERHGLLAEDKSSGAVRYGFIHGNWALDNSRPDGRWCGVNNELTILRETGCYADFPMPSAPSRTQTQKINSIYYAIDDPLRPKSHNTGTDVGAAPRPKDSLLLVQGPLLLDWANRKAGLVPRVENANLQLGQAPSMRRLDLWMKARVQIPARPDWLFVKLHTHGATESNQRVVLGEPMVLFHEELARRAKENANFEYHYVTAREMYNLVKAAEAGWTGSVAEARDFELVWKR